MKKFRCLIASLFVVAALIGCDQLSQPQQKFSSMDVTGAEWGKSFQLTDHNGQPRKIEDFKGKAVALFFGYTNCPDICPTTMMKLASVREKLGKDAERFQVLMVTLDPKRDTPEVLKKYVPAFHPTFLGLSGDEQQVDSTIKDFKGVRIVQKPDQNGFYSVDHTGGVYIFDPQGRLRLFAKDQDSAEVIAQDVKNLIKT